MSLGRSANVDGMTENARKPPYDAERIETERQAAWLDRGDYDAPAPPPDGEHGVYVKSSSPFTSGNLHMGHVRDYSIGDAYARFRRAHGPQRADGVRLRRLRAARRARRDRAPGPARRVGRAERRADARADEAARPQLRLRPRLLQLRRGPVPLVPVALPDPLRDGDDLPRRRDRRLVRHLPDDAGDDPGRGGRHLLALPQRGAADPPADLVPEDHRPTSRRTTPTWRCSRSSPGTSWRSPPSATSSAAPTGSSSTSTGPTVRSPSSPRTATPPGSRPSSCSRRATPRSRGGSVDDAVREELEQLRSGGWERSARDARSVPVVDTGRSRPRPRRHRAAGPDLAAGRRPLRPYRRPRHPRRRRGRRRHRRPLPGALRC